MNPNEFEQINSITLLNVWRTPNTADSLIVLFFILGENHLRINGSEIALTVQYFHVDMGMLLEALLSCILEFGISSLVNIVLGNPYSFFFEAFETNSQAWLTVNQSFVEKFRSARNTTAVKTMTNLIREIRW